MGVTHVGGGLFALLLSVASLTAATGDLRLVEAVKKQDRAAVRTLLQQRVDVNTPQPDGTTALHWAAYGDDLETADRLIRAGAHVNATNELGVTPLYLACTNRNAVLVERLLAAGANPNAALPSGESALMTAARTGSVEVVKALLVHGSDVNGKESAHGETALMWAVANDHPEVVRTLIEVGANMQARSNVRHRRVALRGASDHRPDNTVYLDLGGFTPLLFAARQGALDSARLLLAAGANVNETAPAGTNVLVVAAHSGHGAFAAFLLEKGADPNAAGAGYTALHAAVLRGDLTLVKTLLGHGANPDAQLMNGTPARYFSADYAFNANLVGATPFWLAAKYGEVEMMRLLAASGADPQHAIKDGTKPLMATMVGVGGAVAGGSSSDRRERNLTPTELAAQAPDADERLTFEAATLVIDLGADVNAANRAGDTPLHYAASRGYTTVVQLLLEKGANVNAANQAGDSPLHNAASRAYNPVIQLLADKGANLQAKNKNGQTPLAMTTIQIGIGGAAYVPDGNRQGAAELLLKLGAKE